MNIWPFVTRPDEAPLPADVTALRRAAALLADLVSPVLADHLLARVAARLGADLIDRDAVARDRLLKTFALAQQRRWARCLVEEGIDTVFIKGFANAHTLYADPVVRAQGDLDILVHRAALGRTIDRLAAHGFRFRPGPVNPWGMISDASFMPIVSPDGGCHIDIHVHPDCYPAHRSLTAERVFAEAATVEIDGFSAHVPCPEHALLLCATNAAKDKFYLPSVTKAIDAILLLRGKAATLDWDAIRHLARAGHFLRPMVGFLALLAALETPMENVPGCLRSAPRGLGVVVWRRIVADYRTLFPDEVPLAEFLWREWLVGAEAGVSLHNLLVRLKGVVRPSRGIPHGGPVESGNVLLTRRFDAGL